MKKLVLVLAVAFSASLYSCDNKAAMTAADNAQDAAQEVAAEVQEAAAVVTDTLSNDSVASDTLVVTEAVEDVANN